MRLIGTNEERKQQAEVMGGCPECGGCDGYRNAGKLQVAFCHLHRVAWTWGYNLVSSWREETEEEQRRAFKDIEGYRDAESSDSGRGNSPAVVESKDCVPTALAAV